VARSGHAAVTPQNYHGRRAGRAARSHVARLGTVTMESLGKVSDFFLATLQPATAARQLAYHVKSNPLRRYLSPDNVNLKVSSRPPVTSQAEFTVGALPNIVTPRSSESTGPLTS